MISARRRMQGIPPDLPRRKCAVSIGQTTRGNARGNVMPDLFDVSQEIILITGASQGLGRQFARLLSARGAAVVLAARQVDKLESLEQEIRGRGGRAAA